MSWRFIMTSVALISVPASASVVHAQDMLAQAEQAYLEVDFPQTERMAQAALEAGGNNERRMIRIYQLIGLARSVEGDNDGSRAAYMRMLALDPDIEVDRNQPPHLRASFQEARGYWANRTERFETQMRASRAQGAIRVMLTDPIRMAATIVLYTRISGDIEFAETRVPPRSSQLISVEAIEDGESVEYYAVVIDAYDNTLITYGNEDEPHRIGRLPEASAPREGSSAPRESVLRSPVFWAITGSLLVAGGVTAGILIGSNDFGVLNSTLSVQAQ